MVGRRSTFLHTRTDFAFAAQVGRVSEQPAGMSEVTRVVVAGCGRVGVAIRYLLLTARKMQQAKAKLFVSLRQERSA